MSEPYRETLLEALGAFEVRLLGAVEARLTHGMAELRQDLTSVREDLTSVRQDLTSVRQDLISVRSDLMDRIDRLQDRMVALHEDLVVAMGTSDHALLVARNARDEERSTQEQLSGVARQLRMVKARLDRLEDRA